VAVKSFLRKTFNVIRTEKHCPAILQAFEREFRASEEMVAPNIVARGLGTGLLDGDGFFHGQLMRSAFPDGYTFEDVIAEDDKVVTVERLLVHIRGVVWYSADGQAGNIFSRTC